MKLSNLVLFFSILSCQVLGMEEEKSVEVENQAEDQEQEASCWNFFFCCSGECFDSALANDPASRCMILLQATQSIDAATANWENVEKLRNDIDQLLQENEKKDVLTPEDVWDLKVQSRLLYTIVKLKLEEQIELEKSKLESMDSLVDEQ